MQNAVENYPLVQYSSHWLVIGCGLFAIIFIWYVFVFWLTRRKKQRNVATLVAPNPTLPDIAGLQAKYLALILEVETAAGMGELDIRAVHQKLSMLLRFFAYETKGVRAHVLTLADLRKTRLATVADAIEGYYAPEFSEVKRGDIVQAISKARQVVTTWS